MFADGWISWIARLAEADTRSPLEDGDEYRDRSVLKFRDDGFFIRSPNRVFQLRPAGPHPVRLCGRDGGLRPRRPAGRRYTYPDRSSFALAHAEVILEGSAVARVFEFRLQVDGAEPRAVKDAYVRWRISQAVAVRAGQLKVPFGLQRQVWSAELEFVDRSAATTAFSLERDVGVMLEGRPFAGRARYEVGVLNGSGAGVPNDNLDMAYVARVVAAPFGPLPTSEGDIDDHPYPLVSGGLAGYYTLVPTDAVLRAGNPNANIDVDRNGRIDNVAVWQGGVELRAIWHGAALQTELFSRAEDPGVAGPRASSGARTHRRATSFCPTRLQIGARLGRTDLPLYGVDAATREPRIARRRAERGRERLPSGASRQTSGGLHPFVRG